MVENTVFYLPELSYLTLRFRLIAQQSCTLPTFKGSMLRGAFGHALRRTVCIMPRDKLCSDCILRFQCANTQIFETLILKPPPRFLKGLTYAPKPFVISCQDDRRSFEKDDALVFEMKLFGSATVYFPYLIHAVNEMTQRGFTTRHYKFALFFVETTDEKGQWREIYNKQSNSLTGHLKPLSIPLQQQDAPPDTVTLNFLTPTRIKVGGSYSGDFTFRQLVFAMIRRHLELAHFYSDADSINWEFHDLLEAASNIEIPVAQLAWKDHYRYSHRQKTDMLMGGVIGNLQLRGDLGPFMPLLHSATVLHVGKGTTFGLGKVSISYCVATD